MAESTATANAKQGANKMADEAKQNTAKMADQAKQNTAKMADEATKRFDEATKRFEENTERAKELQSSMAESTKANGRAVVDNYEKAAKNFLDMQRQMAGSDMVEWMQNAARTQIQFAEDVTEARVKAARNLLK